jgi:hypothetical protein
MSWYSRHSYSILHFGASFNLNLQSQSHSSLFNRTWQKRPRELHHWSRFEKEDMTLQMQQAVIIQVTLAHSPATQHLIAHISTKLSWAFVNYLEHIFVIFFLLISSPVSLRASSLLRLLYYAPRCIHPHTHAHTNMHTHAQWRTHITAGAWRCRSWFHDLQSQGRSWCRH